ncbi:family 43 glycosylhydrolase [Streptomyces sp. NPDC051310]|uniref:arabinan endo-1,5-alpha-L-arabinosidase n=1 Tax=Streptomyces sp. NPDC051310 TaxID=3365649 RepID=UPI00379C80B6
MQPAPRPGAAGLPPLPTAAEQPNPRRSAVWSSVRFPSAVCPPCGEQDSSAPCAVGTATRWCRSRTAAGHRTRRSAPPRWWSRYSAENDPWAPDLSYHGGRYLMYYSVSAFHSNTPAIGLATSTTGKPGSWKDQGIVHSSTAGSDYNAIDPDLLVDDDGTWWLAFGSHWSGIKMIRLDPRTGKQYAGDTTRHSLASRSKAPRAVEGPTVVKRNGYYYLFASYDTCCSGTTSTYKIKVGRATKPTGPYYDRKGVAMNRDGGTVVMASHGSVIGPGGQDIMRDGGKDLLVYHYYDGRDNGAPKLGINLLKWSGGWPTAY